VNPHVVVAYEVADALEAGQPVVALESTIIAHGFPYPANRECALEAERICREEGAVPATVAILEGRLRVGISEQEIEHLATAGDIAKASRRDIGTIVAHGADGATTVAGTMLVAAMAGVRTFATGGIGGVPRGAASTFAVSADLEELARTDVAVVCSGAKSVLDLALTVEVLETHGVPILGFQTDEFPAFYTRQSGLPLETCVESAEEAASIIRARREIGLRGGVVVANPIPPEHEIAPEVLEGWIETALADADAAGVSGKDVTPFLLARIHDLSGGASEGTNKELVYSNVRVAARIARSLAES
jgi:pseudouridine-5'-phosphate glycosidase